MFADIAHGHLWAADLAFLIAVIAAGIAAFVSFVNRVGAEAMAMGLLFAAVALIALGLLLL